MKKIISYLIAVMMVFTMMPYTALAASDQNQAKDTINLDIEQYNPLYSDEEPIVEIIEGDDDIALFSEPVAISDDVEHAATIDEAASILRAGMVARQSKVVINLKIREDEFNQEALNKKARDIFNGALKHTGKPNEGDSLKWVYEGCPMNISAGVKDENYYSEIIYTPTYYTTAEQETELTAAVENLKSELNLEGKSDYEKVKAIYDYMAANISYDYANLNDGSYTLKFTAYAALINKTAVCQGYAALFYRMACEYGIDARMVSGTSLNNNGQIENHGWNIVKLGNKYYNLDATWDSTWNSDKATHDFFLKSTDSFKNHTRNDEFTTAEFKAAYPMSEFDYFPELESEAHIFTKKTFAPTCTTAGYDQLVCIGCGLAAGSKSNIVAPTGHSYGEWIIDKEATCTADGSKHKECVKCGKVVTETIPALEHSIIKCKAKAATCTVKGWKAYEECSRCDYTTYKTIPAIGHVWKKSYTVDKKATTKAVGSKSIHCKTCNAVKSGSKVTIAKIKKTTANTLVYNGKKRTANVTVVNTKGKKLVKGTDFTVTYKNAKGTKVVTPKNVGTYKAVVKFKGQYSGTVTKTFKINPKATVMNKLTKPGKKQIKITWQKHTAQVTGYQIQYSTTKNFTKKTTKTVKVKNYRTTSKNVKNLKAKKKYWVKIRTYKTVNGTDYYSAWSKVRTITTK